MNEGRERLLVGHRGPVYCLDKQQEYLYSGGHDCSVRVYELRMNKCVRKFKLHNLPVSSIAVGQVSKIWSNASADGRHNAVHGLLGRIRLVLQGGGSERRVRLPDVFVAAGGREQAAA
eukprot:416187-Hanusia_phi.AAC.5